MSKRKAKLSRKIGNIKVPILRECTHTEFSLFSIQPQIFLTRGFP
jgi:hypothetical protein